MKLTKGQIAQRDKYVEALNAQKVKLTESIEKFNDLVRESWDKVEEERARYDEILADAKTFTEEIAGDIQNFHDDKSEKWQESDRGSAVGSMADDWSGVDLDPVEDDVEKPDDVDEPSLDHAEGLEALPTEPDC